MANHKKTLEQKRKADQRRNAVSTAQQDTVGQSVTFSLPTYEFQTAKPVQMQKQYPAAQTVTLAHGLEKTLIVTAIIIAAQLAIFFLLTHHILYLPSGMVRY